MFKRLFIVFLSTISLHAVPNIGDCVDMGIVLDGNSTGIVLEVGSPISDSYTGLAHTPGELYYRGSSAYIDGLKTYNFGYIESADYDPNLLVWNYTGYYTGIYIHPSSCDLCPPGQIYDSATKTCIDDCLNITPPDEFNGLTYTGKDFPEEQQCLDELNTGDYPDGVCLDESNFAAPGDNACPRWYLYAGCKQPPYEYNGFTLYGGFTTQSECEDYMVNSSLLNTSSCFNEAPYCPWYFYGQPDQGDKCDNLPYPDSYNGYPFAGTYESQLSCTDAVIKLGGGDGNCVQFEECPLYFGYFDTDQNPDTPNDNNDTDGDGLPDGPVPDTNNTQPDNHNDAGTPDNQDTNDDGIDINPLLDQIKQASDRNHVDLEDIKSQLDEINFQLGQSNDKLKGIKNDTSDIKDNTDKANDKLDDLIDLMNEQNDLLKGDNNTSGDNNNTDGGGLNVDMSGVEDRLDTVNDNLEKIHNDLNVSGPEMPDDSEIDAFIENFQEQFTSLQSSFEDAKSIISGELPTPQISTGSDPTFTTTVFGKTLNLDLCASFRVFRPIIMFIFNLIFLIMSIRIVWAAIKIISMGV